MVVPSAFFVAVAILCCASADIITTSLLLPVGLFVEDPSSQMPTFVGQVTVTRSTTYYILDCSIGSAATLFYPVDYGCDDGSYAISEFSASTQYLLEDFEDMINTDAASSSTDDVLQTWTINCDPLETSSSATCTTTYPNDMVIEPITNIESSLYTVIFTAAAGYSVASSTAATSALPSPTSSAATARSTTTPSHGSSTATVHPALSPSSKVGIGLGVPLGACALAVFALLLYRHGKHKERSRKSQIGNLAPPKDFAPASEGKKFPAAGVAGQTFGRSPPVYSMEMQG